jgi:hypothetical protein
MQPILTRKVNAVATLAGAALLALLGALAFGAPSANAAIPEGDDDSYGAAVCFINGAAGVAPNAVDSVQHDAADDDEAWDPGVDANGDGRDDAGNLMDTDGGTFTFSAGPLGSPGAVGAVACAGQDVGGEVIGTTAGTDFRIVAGEASEKGESEYTNLVCGTGHAEGTADLIRTAGPLSAPTDLNTSFSIAFVGGVGQLKITGFEGFVGLDVPLTPGGVSDPDPNDNLQDVDTGIGNGVVHIAPTTGVTEGPNPDENDDTTPPSGGGVDPGGPDGDPGDPNPPVPAGIPCVNQGVAGFTVDAAFEATLSGDTDIGNNDHD